MSVKLTDLHPAWIDYGNRKGLGIVFDCLLGSHSGKPCPIRNYVLFVNPLDGGPPWPGNSRSLLLKLLGEEERYDARGCAEHRWHRTGDTFATLYMTPSWDAHQCGHMTLTNGVFQ